MMTIVIGGFKVDFRVPLDSDSFGIVFKAKNEETGEPAAAKQQLIRNRRDVNRILKEVECMKAVSHPNLVRYLHHHEVAGTVWVFVELCDLGDLDQYFRDKNPDRQEYLQLMQQMANAIVYLHENGVVHRDIKPGNILIKSGVQGGIPIVKIGGFAIAKKVDVRNSTMLSFSTLNIGTRSYMAPELFYTLTLEENVRCDKLVDIFALGITFLSILCFMKEGTRLIPSEDSRACPEYGHEMQYMKWEGNLEKARHYHKEIVPVRGDVTEQKIRTLIRKMIRFDRRKRLESPHVLSYINDIILTLETGTDIDINNIWSVDNFSIYLSLKLGEGRFGMMFKARSTNSGKFAAAKQIKMKFQNRDIPLINGEIESMKSVNHPNIIKVLHHHRDSKNIFWVFFEFCDLGNLDHYFVNNNPDDPEIHDFMKQTARAIKFLHENGIVHGNIKPQNVLLKYSQENKFPLIKITDFGYGKIVEKYPKHDIHKCPFTAPELYNTTEKCDKSVDIFSLGLTFFSIISFNKGRNMLTPCDDASSTTIGNQMFVLSKIGEIERARQYHKEKVAICGTQMERQVRELIQRMIPFEKTRRSTIDEVVDGLEEKYALTIASQEQQEAKGPIDETAREFHKKQDQIKSITALKHGRFIQSVRSDSHKLACAATIINKSWNKSATNNLTINIWKIENHKDQSWKDRDLVINHTQDLENSPKFCEVIAIVENMFLLMTRPDYHTSQVLAVDSANGNVLHKSQVYSGAGTPGYCYCCYKSQILLTDWSSSSITQLDLETLDQLNTWSDERVREPWRVCSNKNRAAVDDKHKYVSVFKWEDEHLSHEKIYTVEFEYCERIYLLQDDTLMGINMFDEWSVWNVRGTPVHTNVQHPTLMSGMIISRDLLQDPASKEWFVQEGGELQDGTGCTVIYNMNMLMNRLNSGDISQIDNSKIVPNTTIEV